MNTTDIVNAILASRNRSNDAYERLLPEMKALDASKVRTVNVEVPIAVSRVLGASPNIWALREEIRIEAPRFQVGVLQKLDSYAYALQEAHVRCLTDKRSPDELRALAEEGRSLRDQLRTDVGPLVSRGLIEGSRLESCVGDNSHKGIATELAMLAMVLLESWPKVKGKCCATEEELHRAEAIADALLAFLGARELSPVAAAEAIDLRNRAFTLLFDNYDQACRVVAFVRRDKGDAEKIAPSLYPTRSRTSEPQEEQPPAPAITAPVPAAGTPVATTTPTSPTVGRPSSNPFMQ